MLRNLFFPNPKGLGKFPQIHGFALQSGYHLLAQGTHFVVHY
jgi:hypothetical protein